MLLHPSRVVRFLGNPLPDPLLSGAAAAMKSINNLLLLGDGESWARQSRSTAPIAWPVTAGSETFVI